VSLFVINRSLNDAVSDSDNIASNIMNINSIIIVTDVEKRSWCTLRKQHGILRKRLRKPVNKLIENSGRFG
jgi:hypothetical protein